MKKIINLSLITTILCQSSAMATTGLAMSASGPLANALSNYTPAKTITSTNAKGDVVKTSFYSGGYYFRFASESYNPPLWYISPPSIEAGCNGFNMKGMFVSILGLDQFGAMLQNAGAALAWGVAIGLIYSLPGVASAFKMINQWAQDIQKLLSMACSSGMAIGQAIGSKVGEKAGPMVNDIKSQTIDKLPSPSVPTFLQDGKKAMGDAFGNLDLGLSASWDSGITFSGKDQISETQRSDIVAKLGNIFIDKSVGSTIYNDYLKRSVKGSKTINSFIKSPINKPISLINMTLTYNSSKASSTLDTSGTKSVFNESVVNMQDNLLSVNDKDTFGMRMLSYIIYYNMTGDLGYSYENLDKFVNSTGFTFSCSNASTGTKDSNCPPTQESDKKLLKNLTEVDALTYTKQTLVGNIKPASGQSLLNFIRKGDWSSVSTEKSLLAPSFAIIVTKENSGVDNYLIVPTDSFSGEKAFGNDDFFGMDAIAQCSLYNSLKNKIPEYYFSDLKYLPNNADSKIALNCDKIPNKVMFSGIDLYTDILYKATDSEKVYGIELLKTYNIYKASEGLLNELSNNLSMSKIGTSKKTNENKTGTVQNEPAIQVVENKSENSIQDQLLLFSKTVDDARTILKDNFKETNHNEIEAYFRYLKDEIAKRSLEKQR